MQKSFYDPWPTLSYEEFKSTKHLLHMAVQVIGKMKLLTPFEPHWSNVCLWITSRGISTGLIPYQQAAFSIEIDCIHHQIICQTTWGKTESFSLQTMSVAEFTQKIFTLLKRLDINITINMTPQEISNPIAFDQDTDKQVYDKTLTNAWWKILVSSERVMQRYHAQFDGESPPIGLMWGTFDIRDARYNGQHVPTTGINSGYIRRNAMNEAQVEIGWWPGNESYPRAAYYSFTYPQPNRIEKAIVQPEAAHWDPVLMEFILNYDDLRQENNPDETLLAFFQTTYAAGADLSNWNPKLITDGVPA